MSDLPIGYWLKHLDRLLESDLDRILVTQSLDRRQWQVLNSLRSESATLPQLDQRLLPFLEEDERTVEPEVEALRRRGWVKGSVSLEPTQEGARAHDALLGRVQRTRDLLTENIGEQEYQDTVDVLKRMSANLERS